MPSDPVDTVRKWLREHGYPLEYASARTLQSAGYRTWQGLHYVDTEAGTPTAREIDVVASEPACWGVANTTLQVVVEAKHAPEPWVVMTHELELTGDSIVANLICSETAAGVLRGHASAAPVPSLLQVPLRHGFSVVQATSMKDPNRTNPAYAALLGVVKAAAGRVAAWRGRACAWAFPVIVTSGSLVQLGYDDAGNESLSPILWQRIVWWGWGARAHPVTVDVVQSDHFAQYVRELRAATQEIGGTFGTWMSAPSR